MRFTISHGAASTRDAWPRGKRIYVQLGYPDGIPVNKNTAEATGLPEGTVCRFTSYIMCRHEDGSFSPWNPTHEDLLADDWHCGVPVHLKHIDR